MGDVLTGNPSNVTTPLSVSITGTATYAAGASTECTTSAPHLFGNGDSVFMNLPDGTFLGLYTITVIDSTHFVANGLPYSGSSLTGQAIDLSLTPQILVATDGDTFSQQLSGALSSLQGIMDRTQRLRADFVTAQSATPQSVISQASSPVANWHSPNFNIANVAGSGNTNLVITSMWDAYYAQWLVGTSTGSACATYGSQDGGKTWYAPPKGGFQREFDTSDALPVCAAGNPNDGSAVFWSLTNGTGAAHVNRCLPPLSAVVTAQAFANDCAFGACAYSDAASTYYFVGLNISTGGAIAATSADGVGLWTNATSSLPSSWSAGSSFTTPRAMIAVAGYTNTVIAVCGQTPGSSTSKLLAIAIGGAMTDITPSFLGGTAKQITGLAFAAASSLWGALCNDATSSYLYISRDLANWTLVHTFTGYLSGGLATLSAIPTVLANETALQSTVTWAACIGTSGTAPDELTRIVYSTNVEAAFAAATDTGSWQGADYADPYGLEPSNVGASSQGLLFSNQQQLLRIQTGGGTPANASPGFEGGTVALTDRAIGSAGSGAF